MKHHRAFALLFIVLVVASVGVTFSLVASLESVLAGNRLRSDGQMADMRMLTMRCGELLLMQVRNNTALTSTGSLTDGSGGSCSYTISGAAPTKTISITATKYTITKRLTITTTQVTPTISATWKES